MLGGQRGPDENESRYRPGGRPLLAFANILIIEDEHFKKNLKKFFFEKKWRRPHIKGRLFIFYSSIITVIVWGRLATSAAFMAS